MRERLDQIAAFVLFALFVLLALRTHSTQAASLIDDAFITYRYAANLANGTGFVYNAGEWVMGTTAPGYGAMLGLLAVVFGPEAIPGISLVVNAIALILMAAAVVVIARTFTRWWTPGVLVSGVVFTTFNLHFASVAGMETPVFMALVAGGLAFAVRERWAAAALLVGLTVWFRPEGVFLVALLGLHLLIAQRPEQWRNPRAWLGASRLQRQVILLVLPGLLMAAWLWLTYGSVLPQSVIAKRAGLYPLSVEETMDAVIRYIGVNVFQIEGFISVINPDENRTRFFMAFGLLVAALLVSLVGFWRHSRVLWIVPVFTAVLVAFFGTSQTLLFDHYYGMFGPLVILCVMVAAVTLATAVHRRLALLALVALVVLFYRDFDWAGAARGMYPGLVDAHYRTIAYRDLARELDPLLPPETRVAMTEIGELGFWLPAVHVLDAAGLVTPSAVDYLPVALSDRINATYGAAPPDWIFDEMPEIIISMDIFLTPGVLRDERLAEHYERALIIDGDWLPWGSRMIQVYARHDSPLLDDLRGLQATFTGYRPCARGVCF